jgi:hypothetical protein
MAKKIYFDMDGTVADLYNYENWLNLLRKHSPSPYKYAKPLVNMDELKNICEKLIQEGYSIGIITWLSKETNNDYDRRVIKAKVKWANKYMPYVTEFKAQKYGVPKQKAVRHCSKMILIDDNENVRNVWNTPKQRISIDATNMIDELKKFIVPNPFN